MQMLNYIYCAAFAIIMLTGAYMVSQYRGLVRMSEGRPNMADLAARIRSGSKVFTKAMYRRILVVVAILSIIIFFALERWAGLAFLVASALTSVGVIVGMRVATYANVRSAAIALHSFENGEPEEVRDSKTVTATAKASQICGLIVDTAGILNLILVLFLSFYFEGMDCVRPRESLVIPLVVRLTASSLGWSIVAMFCRVAGGIFTKTGDMAADIVGKIKWHFHEDDPRNPAVLADFVGDNVNDIDGNQADLGESFVATPVTAIVTAVTMFSTMLNSNLMFAAIAYPLILVLGGLVSSLIGLFYSSHAKNCKSPKTQINISMYIAAGGAMLTSLIAAYCLFGRGGEIPEDFKLGWASLFVATLCGIAAGVIVGLIAQHFTDLESKWAKRVAEAAKEGSALCASMSQAAGWISCFAEVGVVVTFSCVAAAIAGPYGRSVMALGMLSFVAQPIAADAFGPISDNAGGIAESCKLPPEVRRTTDKNDAFGNSSAAVGKGFAIGSAAAVVASQISTYVMAYGGSGLNVVDNSVMFGAFLGGGLIAAFCGLLAKYTIMAADEMAAECIKILQDVKERVERGELSEDFIPDPNPCIHIATVNAMKKMVTPVVITVLATVSVGFIFGPETLGGMLFGVALVGLILAIYFSNAGGLADNAKKRYEAGLMKGYEEGAIGYNEAHDATVVGDTIGDWMKDVVAVSIDIFMKIMGTLAMMLAPLFANYQILSL